MPELTDRSHAGQYGGVWLVSSGYRVYVLRYTVAMARRFDLEAEGAADVGGESDQPIVQKLQYKSEGKPDGKVIPAY